MAYNNPLPAVENLGDGDWEATIAETDCGATDEAQAVQMPLHLGSTKFRLLRLTAKKASGDAATIRTVLGRATDPVTANAIERQAVRDTEIDEQYIDPIFIRTDADGRFYHRSQPSSGTNNVINTTYRLKETWGDID